MFALGILALVIEEIVASIDEPRFTLCISSPHLVGNSFLLRIFGIEFRILLLTIFVNSEIGNSFLKLKNRNITLIVAGDTAHHFRIAFAVGMNLVQAINQLSWEDHEPTAFAVGARDGI